MTRFTIMKVLANGFYQVKRRLGICKTCSPIAHHDARMDGDSEHEEHEEVEEEQQTGGAKINLNVEELSEVSSLVKNLGQDYYAKVGMVEMMREYIKDLLRTKKYHEDTIRKWRQLGKEKSSRNEWKRKEIQGLRDAITELNLSVQRLKQRSQKYLTKMSNPIELMSIDKEDFLKLCTLHLKGHITSSIALPSFISHAVQEMIRRENIEKVPIPLERLMDIKKKNPYTKEIPTTALLSVMEIVLRHYVRS